MPELGLEIAGLRTAILTRDTEVARVIRGRYQGFLAAGPPEWRLRMASRPAGGPPFADDVVVARADGGTCFMVRRQDFKGTLDLDARRGEVTLADPDDVSIDAFLRIVYSLALLDAHGLVVHAASLIKNETAYLFSGPSGSGKTTIARLSPDAMLLSDELSIVKATGGRAVCHGTPFWGELARAGEPRSAPLRAIYFLRQGDAHAVVPLRPREALARLLRNVLFFAPDAHLAAQVLRISAELIEAVPCRELSFRLDSGFWEVIGDD